MRCLEGEIFGKWEVIDRAGSNKTNQPMWKCRCQCGRIKDVNEYSLISGKSNGCRSCSNFYDLKGKKFGYLTVLEKESTSRDRSIQWKCKCDCGNIVIVDSKSLRKGKTRSCGCFKTKKLVERMSLKEGESSFNKMYYGYKSDATKRGLAFDLSKERFKELTQLNCYYCGRKPNQLYYRRKNGGYIGNGIDRVNNNDGYIEENVVPCCRQCNYAKGSMHIDDFEKWIKKVYNNLFEPV
jgi:hypothetical protein